MVEKMCKDSPPHLRTWQKKHAKGNMLLTVEQLFFEVQVDFCITIMNFPFV